MFSIGLVAACAQVPVKLRAQSSTFYTEPAGARVTLDGKTIGRTPVTVTLPDREQIQVRFELGGYLPLTQDLERDPVEAGSPAGVGWGNAYAFPLIQRR